MARASFATFPNALLTSEPFDDTKYGMLAVDVRSWYEDAADGAGQGDAETTALHHDVIAITQNQYARPFDSIEGATSSIFRLTWLMFFLTLLGRGGTRLEYIVLVLLRALESCLNSLKPDRTIHPG